MGRPLRISYPNAFYHVTARGNERQNIFRSNKDRERFLEYLESATERYIVDRVKKQLKTDKKLKMKINKIEQKRS